ncbi:MAG: hypothetical protein HZB46_14395, partial [Solirubrobacterales bacterium]|nr:hypothetical protein [Solirubrobacterales bacterium]
MRALAELLVLVAAAGLVWAIVRTIAAGRREQGVRWRVDTRTRPDGTLVVAVRRGATDERIVRELPPGMDPAELAAELRLAREDAELAVD